MSGGKSDCNLKLSVFRNEVKHSTNTTVFSAVRIEEIDVYIFVNNDVSTTENIDDISINVINYLYQFSFTLN